MCLLFLVVGGATWSLRAASSSEELGKPPVSAPPTTIAAVGEKPAAFANKTIALTGRITERCPMAGCWFNLNDGTGDLRIDARPGRFSVLGLAMGARVTVFGSVVKEPGEGPQLAAGEFRM